MAVDVVTATWLKAASALAVSENGMRAAAWGDLATVSEILSPLALTADAQAEAAAQLDFLGHAAAIDKVELAGRREDLVGGLLDFTAAGGGYEAGERVLVLSASPVDGGRTALTVLRRLT